MKEFLSPEAAKLSPYTPGEQPLDKKYVKLNTNESPFPPSPKVLDALSREESEKLNLYPDPACRVLTDAIAKRHGVKPENARDILPNCLKSELYMTANLREWRHILKLRTDPMAHPQMRKLAGQILDVFNQNLPVIVEDIVEDIDYEKIF